VIPNPAKIIAIPQLVPRFAYPPSPKIKQGITAQSPPHPSPMKIGGIINQKLPLASRAKIANTPHDPMKTNIDQNMFYLYPFTFSPRKYNRSPPTNHPKTSANQKVA
jgi:hypothetical protein